MKSAYELAMERLERDSPAPKLTDEQKAQIADVEQRYKAKEAEKEVFLGGLIEKARAAGDFSEVAAVEEQLARELRRIRDQGEAEREKIRRAADEANAKEN